MDVESTSPSEPSLSTEDAPRPRRRGRRWLIIIGVVVVLLGVLIALAPTLVSTGPGTRLLLSVVNGYIPGKADVADLSAGWFSGTSVNGLTVADPDGRVVISIHTIAMPDFTLAKAVGGSAEYGTITVTRPEVTYEQYADGTNSITRALVKPGPTVPPPTEAEAPSKPSAPIRAKLVVSDAAIQCILPGQDPVGVEGLTVNAEIAALASITADAAATVRQGSSTGEINLKKLVAKNLFDAAGEFQPDRATINAEAKLARLPVALLDALAQADGKLLALLGDKAEINLSANGMLANLTGDVTVLTPRLTARTDFARTEKAVTLSAAVHTIIEPSVWTQLAAGKDGPILPAITKPVVVDLVLEKHTQPFEQERIDLAAILAKITLQPVDLVFDTTGGPATATLTKTGTQVTLTVPPLLVVTLWKHFEGQDETLAKVGLGDTATVTAEITELTQSTGEKSGLSFKGGVRSPKIAVTGLPQVNAVTVTDLSADLAYDTSGGPTAKAAEGALDLKNARVEISLAVPQAVFKLAESSEVIAVKDFTAQVSSTDIAEQATVLAKSQFAAGAETGTLDSKTTVRQLVDPKGNLQLAEAGIDTDTRLKDIPLRLVDALAGLGGNLVRCVGPTLRQMDITAKSAGGEEPVNFGLAMRSDLVTADVNGVFTPGERLSFSSGSAATFTVTNDTLEMVQDWSAPTSQADKPVAPPVQRLTLQKPVTCRLNIAQADLAWLAPSAGDSAVPSGQPEPMRVDPAHTRLDVNLTGEPIALVMADSGKLVTVSNLKVTAATENPAKETVATLHLDVEVAKSGEPPAHGKLDSQTSLKNLVASDGLLQADKATIATNTSITNVPTQPIDALAGLNGKLYELLGPTLQASVVGTFHPNENSPMRVTLDSPNTQGDLRFVIDKDLVLRLEQDGRLLAKLTPELSKNLGLANPLFFQAVQSDKPIELTVESGTMAVPLSPMDLAAARVDGQLAMGTVTMQNGGLLRLTLMMLKQIGAVEEVGDTMKVTFTPLTVHLDRGIISSNDLWLSSDLITMGTQVLSVDLNPALESDGPFDAGKVPGDILIGLSGRDLLRISALKGVLDPTYIYELQVKGPINDLKPDFADFIIQIGKMKAQAQAAQQLARLGAGGALAARLLEQLPQGKNQAEIQKRWTNQPEPRAAQSQQTPPADSEKAPEGKAPEPDSKPALPRLPGL